jgi:protein-S-isoprenylcysteine O-methyltransferase Ste14
MYAGLARKEEQDIRQEFGAEYDRYAEKTPAFFPRWRITPILESQGSAV